MSERNGLNRRSSSLCGNENPSKFDPLCRPATRGLHHGQGLSSTNRSDTSAQTNPPTPKILLAIGRRTIQFPHPRRRLLEFRNSCATLTHPPAQKIGHSRFLADHPFLVPSRLEKQSRLCSCAGDGATDESSKPRTRMFAALGRDLFDGIGRLLKAQQRADATMLSQCNIQIQTGNSTQKDGAFREMKADRHTLRCRMQEAVRYFGRCHL